jgi:hypothetical protein
MDRLKQMDECDHKWRDYGYGSVCRDCGKPEHEKGDTMATRKQSVPADEVGIALHTAMRKWMDGLMSAYAWNVVHLLSDTWRSFCEAVAESDATTGLELEEAFKEWGKTPIDERKGKDSLYAYQIFRITLEEFNADDWDTLAKALDWKNWK